MAWRRPGDKPLSEPMTVRFPTHICVTRPQGVNSCRIEFISFLYLLLFLYFDGIVYVTEILPRERQREVHLMVVDDLAMQGSKASTTMVLTHLSRNIPLSAQEGLTYWDLDKMTDFLADDNVKAFSWLKIFNCEYAIHMLLKCVFWGPGGGKSGLLQGKTLYGAQGWSQICNCICVKMCDFCIRICVSS